LDNEEVAMPEISPGRGYYSTVMPVAGILYVIVLFATGFNGTVVIIGALVFALVAVVGSRFRPRNRSAAQPPPQSWLMTCLSEARVAHQAD